MKRKIAKAKMRIVMILREFFLKSRYYSISYAIYSTAWWLGWYIPTCSSWAYWGLKKKTEWMNRYFKKNYSHIIEKYKNYSESSTLVDDYNIWVFWAQGEENMPELVRACYKNLCKHNGATVKLLTMDNVGEYVNIPQCVFEKLKKGIVSYTHFSDILRISLLAKYGGVWVDSTCWVAQGIPTYIKNMSFCSCKTNGVNLPSLWSNSRWCSWSLGSNNRANILFMFVRDMLLEHARVSNCWIDYLLLDYLLFFAYNEFDGCRKMIDDVPENNVKRNELWGVMNQKYDENRYKEITKDTWLFKLSYKTELNEKTVDGEDTFYGKMIKGEL